MSLVTLAYALMVSPKAHFCFRPNLREGNIGPYSRNYSLVDLQNKAPSGGECIEQPRTIVIRIRAFISNISKIPLTVPLLNYQKKTNIPFWCFLHNFPRDLVLREVEEGVVRIIQPQFPRRGTIRKPIMFPYQGNIRGVFHQ